MSVFEETFSFLSVKPQVRILPEQLIARTAFLWRLLSIFSYSKVVTVDKAARTVVIDKRIFWLFTLKTTIPFDRIKRIKYGFDNFFSALTATRDIFWRRTDQLEIFSVALELTDPADEVGLFNFFGEGAVMTGWTGVLLFRDSLVDYSGDQQESSLGFVELLMQYTDKKLV